MEELEDFLEYELPRRSAEPIETETVTVIISEIIPAPDLRRR
jgi:hypothetical protein